MGLVANFGGFADLVVKKARQTASGVIEKLAANKTVGGTVAAVREGIAPFSAAGGIRGAGRGLRTAAQMNAEAKRLLDEARIERAIGGGYVADLLEQRAKMLQDDAMLSLEAAGGALTSPVKAAWGGAKAWFSPRGDWTNWGKRMGMTAGSLFAAGTGWRFVTGQGGPFTNDRGQFDIAGIPFV